MDEAEKLALFCGATGASTALGRGFLADFDGDVEQAVNAYFMSEQQHESAVPAAAAAPPSGPAPTATTAAKKLVAQTRGAAGNVRSLADLGGSDSDDEERPIETFIGGAKSGQMVQDPKQPKKGGEDRVSSLFDSARQAGALDGNPEDLRGGKSEGKAFTGSARTLSGAPPAPPVEAPGPGPLQPIVHTISFYRNGFVVNDGPLRSFDDPANAPFMEAIATGVAPEELRPKNPMQPINVNLVRKGEDYTPPPEPKYTAFSGSGRTLGATGGEAATSAAAAAGAGPSGAGASASLPVVPGSWEVDESQPTTTLQLRLLDGQRVVAKFNTSHTVGHIRAFIEALHPGDGRKGTLVSGMPPQTLGDASMTLQDAGLLNCVVMQKA